MSSLFLFSRGTRYATLLAVATTAAYLVGVGMSW